MGSVFSPWYFRARKNGRRDPEDHCALNVMLRGPRARRWVMTERGQGTIQRDASRFVLGPSALRWDGASLLCDIVEHAAPWPRLVRGTIRVIPLAVTGEDFALSPDGVHRWWPVAPLCRVEVAMTSPDISWSGAGYLDSNWGGGALEDAFTHWDWSCARLGGRAAILYETWRRDGGGDCLAVAIDARGAVSRFAPPPRHDLARTAWRLARTTRAETVASVRTLDDTPFYARSIVRSRWLGEDAVAMHESLSLDRYRSPWMQAMLPFRMRREAGRRWG